MRRYIHTLPDWPELHFNAESVLPHLARVRNHQGRLIGQMENLGFSVRSQAQLDALTAEVVQTSAIEGEYLPPDQVRSSIARRLGMDVFGLPIPARNVDGVVEMILNATMNLDTPLTRERLFAWHGALFPTGHSGLHPLLVGAWRDDRDGPMRVVSGPMGRERIHYEAPAADRIDAEMDRFLTWFNAPDDSQDPVIRAALAHLWFVTIHPFDDGNGRIARAIADRALAASDDCPQRFYSMSAQIYQEKKDYYDTLETVQSGGSCDVTDWVLWFLGCLERSFAVTDAITLSVLAKEAFWAALPPGHYSERQKALIGRLLDGFTGKLTSGKWATIAKISQDSAYRDILELVERGVLVKEDAGGRSTSYRLARLTQNT
jgi:Fic family protein